MFVRPTECPCCSSELEYDAVSLWCMNTSCAAQIQGSVSHFFKTMDIKGVGPVTAGQLNANVVEILSMTELELVTLIGNANGSKLFQAITIALREMHDSAKLIAAMGIPSVGQGTAVKLAKCIKGNKLTLTEEALVEAGITPATRGKILLWSTTDYIDTWGAQLPLKVKDSVTLIKSSGLVVCVTGKIEGYTRDSIASYLSSTYGCTMASSVTKKVNYLVCESTSNSSSTIKAQSLGIPILTLNQLENILNVSRSQI